MDFLSVEHMMTEDHSLAATIGIELQEFDWISQIKVIELIRR